jgi:tetratricopeptide (TPR) repeat protein
MKTLLLLASATLVAAAGLSAQLTSLHPKTDPTQAQQYLDKRAKAIALIEAKKYSEAITIAEALTKAAPDDIDSAYVLAKAHRLAGHLDQAEKTTQWMLNLRPDNPNGLWEAALLRESFGDLEGAIDFLNAVYRATPLSKYKDRREVLIDLARILDKKGLKADAAIIQKEIDRTKGLSNENSSAPLAHP